MKTITLEELSANLAIMFTKFPYDISEMNLEFKDGVLNMNIRPIVGIENIDRNFTIEKDADKVVPPPPPPPPPRLLKEGKEPPKPPNSK